MFQPGQSGNLAGRPKGSVNKSLAMLREAADTIIPTLIEKALAGDMEAARLIIERGVPKLKPVSSPEAISLPGGGLLEQVRALLQQVAAGDISAETAAEMLRLMGSATSLLSTAKKAGMRVRSEPPPAVTGNAYLASLQQQSWNEQQNLMSGE